MSLDTDRMVKAFTLVRNVVERAFLDTALEQAGGKLTPTQYQALRFIGLHDGACIRDLAASLHVSHPAAVKLVERLAAAGLVLRCPCPEDRRRVCLSLSANGRSVWSEARARHEELVGKALQRMGEEQAASLLGLLLRFVRASVESVDQLGKICLYCGVEHSPGCPVAETEEILTGRPRDEY
ncbi:MAG: MarR family transcriptional regulator [Armatimonadetes bacterium]|nr:MarR family transcriptional regulator [Armatimonadota bacterium]